MPWVRIDDAIYDHPKAMAAGLEGVGLVTLLLAWSNRNLTDGRVPDTLPARFGADGELAERMIALGWLERVDGGFAVHDYLDYQPSAEEIRTKRERERDRWRRRGDRSTSTPDDLAPDSKDPPRQLRAESDATPRASQPQPQENPNAHPFDAEFEEWWTGYPRKIDKTKARAKYVARRRSGTTVAELIAARDHYAAAAEGHEAQYVKYPSSFLHSSWAEWVNGPPEGSSNGASSEWFDE